MSVARKLKTFSELPEANKFLNQSVKVTQETLDKLECKSIVARGTAVDEEILSLIEELKSGTSAHSWQRVQIESRLSVADQLLHFESSIRPTMIFFYHAVDHSGREKLIGTGAISSRINNQFEFEGFPVVSRCFIFEKYRNLRLYSPVLTHRISVCKEMWGPDLKAIHLGSAHPRIFEVVKKNFFDHPIVYVGNEFQKYNHDQVRIKDYLWLGESWKNQLINSMKDLVARTESPELTKIFHLLNLLCTNEFKTTSFASLNREYQSAKTNGLLPELNNFPLHQLLSLLLSIPVLQEDKEEVINLENIVRRKSG